MWEHLSKSAATFPNGIVAASLSDRAGGRAENRQSRRLPIDTSSLFRDNVLSLRAILRSASSRSALGQPPHTTPKIDHNSVSLLSRPVSSRAWPGRHGLPNRSDVALRYSIRGASANVVSRRIDRDAAGPGLPGPVPRRRAGARRRPARSSHATPTTSWSASRSARSTSTRSIAT